MNWEKGKVSKVVQISPQAIKVSLAHFWISSTSA
jgi:hypothetical protein